MKLIVHYQVAVQSLCWHIKTTEVAMKKLYAVFMFAALCASIAFSQNFQINNLRQSRFEPALKNRGTVLDLSTYRSPKKPGHYTIEDWRALVDSLWGPGEPTSTKLEIFDFFWNTIDRQYGGFPYLEVNWDSMKTLYRPKIEAGVSRGRFWGIMDQLYLALQDINTWISDTVLDSSYIENGQPVYKPGIPAFCLSGWGWVGNFGAALTPLPDSSLLVYRAIHSHPLGIVPGDIVLGYDRIPWKQLYKDLLSAQLPLEWWGESGWGSSPRSMTHALLNSAGKNWGLFDTLDVVKYDTGDTLHLATAPLNGLAWYSLFATDQVAVPGIIMPDYGNEEHVTYGVVDNTSIGYVYVYLWNKADGLVFKAAMKDLITVKKVTGLIFDFRYNYSSHDVGNASEAGLDYLFNENPAGASRWRTAKRSDPTNHLSFTYLPPYDASFSMQPDYYDRPIAVLTGPHAWGFGDFNSFRMRFHPMVRFFGLPTNGAFIASWIGAERPVWGTWYYRYTDGQMQSLVNDEGFLMHKSFPVDEEIWLTRDDVAKGEDTVVKRAIEWINNLSYAHNVSVDRTLIVSNADTVIISAIVENPNIHPLTVLAVLTNDNNAVLDSMYLYDDGLHHDVQPGDKIWANSYVNNSEQTVRVSISTEDPVAGDTRRLSNAVQFTSIGPLVFDGIRNVSTDQEVNAGDDLKFKFKVRNNGSIATAMNVTSHVVPLDTCASINTLLVLKYGNIAPGTSVEGTTQAQGIRFSRNCGGCTARFALEIFSSGYHFWSDTSAVDITTTGIREHENIVKEFYLEQNYPNPFNPTTTISYDLPQRSHVLLRVYDIQGREVTTLVNRVEQPGLKSVNLNAEGWSSGIYYYRLQAEDFVQTKKLVLLR
jgi:hypothetical protein